MSRFQYHTLIMSVLFFMHYRPIMGLLSHCRPIMGLYPRYRPIMGLYHRYRPIMGLYHHYLLGDLSISLSPPLKFETSGYQPNHVSLVKYKGEGYQEEVVPHICLTRPCAVP